MLRKVKRCWKRKMKLVMVVVAVMMLRCGGDLKAEASLQTSHLGRSRSSCKARDACVAVVVAALGASVLHPAKCTWVQGRHPRGGSNPYPACLHAKCSSPVYI